jgi:hypothetical protein
VSVTQRMASCDVDGLRRGDGLNAVLKLTAGRGVDHVIEVSCPGTLAHSLRQPPPGNRQGRQHAWDFRGYRAMLEELAAGIRVNGIKPVIDRLFPFEAAHGA